MHDKAPLPKPLPKPTTIKGFEANVAAMVVDAEQLTSDPSLIPPRPIEIDPQPSDRERILARVQKLAIMAGIEEAAANANQGIAAADAAERRRQAVADLRDGEDLAREQGFGYRPPKLPRTSSRRLTSAEKNAHARRAEARHDEIKRGNVPRGL